MLFPRFVCLQGEVECLSRNLTLAEWVVIQAIAANMTAEAEKARRLLEEVEPTTSLSPLKALETSPDSLFEDINEDKEEVSSVQL